MWTWAFVPRNMGFTGVVSCVECGPEQPKEGMLSSDGRLERGEGGTEATRWPQMSLCSHSLSSWLGTSDWLIRTYQQWQTWL